MPGAETRLCWDLPAPNLRGHAERECLVKYFFLSGQEGVAQGLWTLRPGLARNKKAEKRLMGSRGRTLQFKGQDDL